MKKFIKGFVGVTLAIILLVSCLVPCFSIFVSAASITIDGIFTDNMVLQRDKTIVVYGTGSGYGTITVGDQTRQVSASGGKWKVEFPSMKASTTPITFEYDFGSGITSLKNVLVGDVYVTSGQSNMEFALKNTEQKDSGAKDSDILRFRKSGSWQCFTKTSVQDLTAIGTLFAQELETALNKKIPIGIISASVGASRIEDWTSSEYCVCDKYCQNPHSDAEVYDKGHHDLYKNYIAPIISFPIAGVLWYQGESNRGSGEALYYYDMFKNMVDCWREAWGDKNLPFYTVQIMLYTSDGGVDRNNVPVDEYNIRIAQGEAAKKINNVTVCTMLSYEDTLRNDGVMDIHPTDKLPIAKALANAALSTYYKPKGDYKSSPEYSGPLYTSVSVKGNTATVSFSHANGLKIKDGDYLTDFEVRNDAGNWTSTKGTISGGKVVLTLSEGTITGVRLGYHNAAQVNLYNSAGYCASPFIWEDANFVPVHSEASRWSTDSEGHWKACNVSGCDEKFHEGKHSGGEAKDCWTRAICETCGWSYGDTGPHPSTEVRDARPATETEEGFTGVTYCTKCNMVVDNGKKIPVLEQKKQNGDNGPDTLIIILVVVCCVVALAVVVVLVVVIVLMNKKKSSKQEEKPKDGENAADEGEV